jgi:ribonucleoside-diphosphate reductase alpha chain
MTAAIREWLPHRRFSMVVAFEHDGLRCRASAGYYPNGKIGEIFLDVGKAGSSVQSFADTAAVLTSLLLQHNVSVDTIRHSITGPIATALDLIVAEQGES